MRDPDWPPPVSRAAAYRVYASSSDDDGEGDAGVEALQPRLRSDVLRVLESGDGGVYEEWAVLADDALSLEELQFDADRVESCIESDVVRRRRPRCAAGDDGARSAEGGVGEDDLADIDIGDAVGDMVEVIDGRDLLAVPAFAYGKRGHRRIETLDDGDVEAGVPPLANGKRGHRRIETLEDIDVPTAIPPLTHGKRGHRRIETLEDIDVPTGIPPLSYGKRGHRRIETLEDIQISAGTPPLSHGKRGHHRIETLEDIDVPIGIPPLPPGKRGHDRIETPALSMKTHQPNGHNRVETLDDFDLYDSPPALKRIETLPDEPLDTPVLNGVQKMRFEDMMTLPIPPALPSPIDPDDASASLNSDIESNANMGSIDTLSERTAPATSPSGPDIAKHAGKVCCPKLSELCNRVSIVTRSLASIQMVTASHAASAEATLSQNTADTRAEISRLRITLDHVTRLTLAQAHATLDAVHSHTHTRTHTHTK